MTLKYIVDIFRRLFFFTSSFSLTVNFCTLEQHSLDVYQRASERASCTEKYKIQNQVGC